MKQPQKAIFTADTSSVTHTSSEQLRIAKEYQNQPTLAQVKAADAYARNADASAVSTYGLNLGQGSNISVLTNSRFDPTHPEFSSSHSDASYDTLTRFYLGIDAGNINTIANVIPLFFNKDSDELVQVYDTGFNSNREAFVTIPVPALNDGTNTMAFETISRSDFEVSGATAIRMALQGFLVGLVGGDRVTQDPVTIDPTYFLLIDTNNDDFFELTDSNSPTEDYNHIGRVYDVTSNITSYQIVATSSTPFQDNAGDDLSGINGYQFGIG